MRAALRPVWVVDDSPTDADYAKAVLSTLFDVTVFHDGAAVLEALSNGPPPDVVVLDWIMHEVSGLDVCRFLRSSEGTKARVAILLVTANRAARDVAEGLAAGANDYLAKPYVDDELIARVGALVRGKELLERVERAEQTVSRVLSQSPEAMLVIDAHNRLTYANPEAERLLRAPAVALIGRPVHELLPELALDQIRASADQRLVALPDLVIGDEIHAPIARPLSDDFAASAMITLRNVTERRETEARRLDFYSIVAHDLRSPLSTILLRTEVILSGQRGILSSELISDVRKIQKNIHSMVSLINDFLDLAKLENRGYRLEREDLDLGALIRAAIEEIRPVIEQGGLDATIDVPRVPLVVSADRRRLMQVLGNLLSNAIKFTPAGGRIGVALAQVGGKVELRITDTGIGIAGDAVPTLFQRYRRVDGGSHAGTGLGLMIVREIVEAHGGEVGVESEPGRGSTFWIRLPAVRARSPWADVLVVDDDQDNRETLAMLLEMHGYSVATAENGADALEMLSTREAPAAIVLDMLMPVMTGPQLLEKMAVDERLARIPVLVMSGDLSILARAPHGALVLQKPIQVDRLLDYVARQVQRVDGARA